MRGSHHFLPEADIVRLRSQLGALFPKYPGLWAAEPASGEIAGFMGLAPDSGGPPGSRRGRVDLLFVYPNWQKKGAGGALIGFAAGLFPDALTLEVNEQCPGAREFYQKMGFKFAQRLPLDHDGRPFPLLRLRLAKDAGNTTIGEQFHPPQR